MTINRGIVVSVLVMAGAAQAGPVDAVLCQRLDTRFDNTKRPYLSVTRTPAPTASADDAGKVTVCKDAAKKSCTTFDGKSGYGYASNSDGTLLVASGEAAMNVLDATTGKVKRTIKSKRDKEYSCGGGLWLGDVVLASGMDCHEFDALPYLVNGKTGKYIAPLVDKKLTTDGETMYDAFQLDAKQWAISIYNHNEEAGLGLGKVFVIDVTTGKVLATAQGTKAGGADITEGKATRSVAKLTSCAP